MKMGQMASVANDLLPKEIVDALASLQHGAPPMSYETICAQVEAELGAPPEALFARFGREPFAAASIGQVHRAALEDGREVVVKVQYPGVDQAVDSDLLHLKLALKATGIVRIERRALDALFEEIRAHLHEELDYATEAEHVRTFAAAFAEDPTVVVPEVIEERSSGRILTLTYEAGRPLATLTPESAEQALRDGVATSLFRIFARQIFELHMLHADPNPANFAVKPDGTLVLYDFGCIKRLPAEIVEAYRDTVRAALDEDYDGVEQGLVRLGARNLEGPPVPAAFYKQWRDLFARPFVGPEPFDYSRSSMHDDALRMIPEFLAKHLRSFVPPVELAYLNRAIVGHYANIRRLGARGRYRDLLDPYL
jgi:predicted unusual protein kinase regulating ubiquinone biosynthesis (AarF/ABC1/UbiB family)